MEVRLEHVDEMPEPHGPLHDIVVAWQAERDAALAAWQADPQRSYPPPAAPPIRVPAGEYSGVARVPDGAVMICDPGVIASQIIVGAGARLEGPTFSGTPGGG